MGIAPSVGVTHICLNLAIYLKVYTNSKVAIIQCEDNCNLYDLFTYIDYINMPNHYRNIIKNISYYISENFSEEEIYNYDYAIMDFGSEIKRYKYNFDDCFKRVFVSSLNIWNYKLVCSIFDNEVVNEYKKWIHVYSFGNEDIKRILEEEYAINFYRFPYFDCCYINDVNDYFSLRNILKI